MSRLSLFPSTATVNNQGRLVIGGCDTVELAAEFGTPLYLFDEVSLRSKCAELKSEFGQRYKDTVVIYAAKAFINRALAIILKEEGRASPRKCTYSAPERPAYAPVIIKDSNL